MTVVPRRRGILVVNGRFLRQRRPTGIHRVARALVAELRRCGVPHTVLAPARVEDPLADATLPSPPGRFGDHAFEQLVLPAAAGARPLLSLGNTAPVVRRWAAVMVHDLAQFVEPRWFRPEMRIYGRVALLAARRAQVVLCPTRRVAEELAAAGVERRRISVVRNAAHADARPAPPASVAAVTRRLGIADPYVVHVGWANPQKDVATAVAAHRRAAAVVPHQLVLVGTGHPSFAPVRLPPLPSIVLAGWVADPDLWALLTGARALICPSRYEGFGLPPVEAMSCGCVALVSDIESLRESTDGGAVYLPPGDVAAWTRGLLAALRGELPPPRPVAWTWADAAAQLIAALEPFL